MNARLPSVEHLIKEFSKMPTIGRRTAQKLAFYVMKLSKQEAKTLAQSILDVKENITFCSICYNLTEDSICSICVSDNRNKTQICVVEGASDIMAIEKSKTYNGLYHVLGGVLSPIDGVEAKDLRIEQLLQRTTSDIKEIILATNPSAEGESTALYLTQLLVGKNIRITRIARGIPMGSEIEFSDDYTISKAIDGRMEITL